MSAVSQTHLVVLTGAGMSAESGIPTFRAADGLWENHRVEDVATPEAFLRDPDLVLRFYNERRRGVMKAEPNKGHLALAEFESQMQVSVITQNIDDLHERAGSSIVLHLHGEILKARGIDDEERLYDLEGADIHVGDLNAQGYQLRPHVVWFGEAVPAMEEAARITAQADIFLVVGTSLAVYPAASLVSMRRPGTPVLLVDPNEPHAAYRDLSHIQHPASTGVPIALVRVLEFAMRGHKF
ncbi:MAG: NAD-dependent deacylase [Planctomycetota bacterium]|jgi:NAD-dependent deacetylase|nr:NAD-dependent deacylase [Planctomycetota bacterium]